MHTWRPFRGRHPSTTGTLPIILTISETVLPNTGSSFAPNDPAQLFWSRVKAYYTAYYQGNFMGYFSAQPVAKPAVQLSITDDEVTQAAAVFLELVFDQIWPNGLDRRKEAARN